MIKYFKDEKVKVSTKRILCLGGTDTGACYGGQGSPAIVWKNGKAYVIDIASYPGGPVCEKYKGSYSVLFTNVAKHLSWIDNPSKRTRSTKENDDDIGLPFFYLQ